jgi:diacylglycerol kinase family enzyme
MIAVFLFAGCGKKDQSTASNEATANDEMLNLIAFKACNIVEMFNLFIRLLKGEHLDSNNVIYLRGREFEINCSDSIDTDIDGEAGPSFPLSIGISHKKLKVFAP